MKTQATDQLIADEDVNEWINYVLCVSYLKYLQQRLLFKLLASETQLPKSNPKIASLHLPTLRVLWRSDAHIHPTSNIHLDWDK